MSEIIPAVSAIRKPGQIYIVENNGSSITFTSPLSSPGGSFTKNGIGALVFAAANTYDGATTVNSGTLRYGVDNATGTGPVILNGAAVLDLNGHVDSVGIVTLDGGSAIIGGTLTSTGSFEVKNGTVSAVLAGAGTSLNKTTGGTDTLTGDNTYAGGTQVRGGLLKSAAGMSIRTASGRFHLARERDAVFRR